MVKCPKGTPEQVAKNLAYLKSFKETTEINCTGEDVCKSESEELFCPEEGGYPSITEYYLPDDGNPLSTEEEITYLFVNHFLHILLKCWDGKPCRKLKPTQVADIPKSEGEMSERENIPDDKQIFDLTEEYLSDLYKTKSQKLVQDNKQDKASMEETLSAICRERCESKSKTSNEPEVNEDEEDYTHSWKTTIPDEDVYMSFLNGAWYKGRVSRRLMNGSGTFFWEDGTSFQGEFKAGTVTGYGRMEFPDLSVYEGEMYKGFRHGEGLQCMYDSPLMYSGEWWLGKKSGQGIIFYSDPKFGLNYYNGSWVNGKQEGFGYRQYQSGAKYLGYWKNGKRDGRGIMFWCNNDIYRGDWKNGLMDGFGEYMWRGFVNKTFSCARVNAHRGYWANGKRNGLGMLELSNGSIIETLWVNNEKNGPGVVVCQNGSIALSNQKLFNNDKQALLNESEDNVLKKLIKSHGLQTGRRKTSKKDNVKISDESQLLAYMSSMEKAKTISIPIHTPVHSLDLTCHIKKLKEQKELLTKNNEQINILGLNNTPRMELLSQKTLELREINQSDEAFSLEEKLLRYAVMVNLTRLKDCYEQWSIIACANKPPFRCNLLRIFFWELLTVAGVPMRNFSLVDADNVLDSEISFLVDSPHDPFEKIQLWQFIQFLISLSWHIYGQYVYAQNASLGREEVADFLTEFYNEKEKAVLSSAFNYFLQKHIFAEWETAENVIKNWDLVPMGAMYLAYRSIGEPHSAKEFLIDFFRKKEEPKPKIFNLPCFEMGKNMIPITNEVSYITVEENFNHPEICSRFNDRQETSSNDEETYFNNLQPKDIVHCLIQACPHIMEDDLIVDMEYQLTFLEYYKTMILCAAVSLKKKSLKKIQSEILLNYKKELEEYNRKMKEYEIQKEAMLQQTKKMTQTKKSKKKF